MPKNIILDGIEYTPVKKEDTRHPWRYSDTVQSIIDFDLHRKEGVYWLSLYLYSKDINKIKRESEKYLAIDKIKQYISDTFWVFEPDWTDSLQKKYFIIYNYDINEFLYGFNHSTKMYSPIWYFSCQEHAKEIREKFDKELRIIFDIE